MTSCGSGDSPTATATVVTTTRPTPPPPPPLPLTTAPAPAPPPLPPATTPSVLTGQIVTRLPTTRHVVALTFDAGAGDTGIPKILAALGDADVPATFFMTGRWAELYPMWARRIAAGYPIGNHTFDHQDLLKLSPAAVKGEILTAQEAITRTNGRPPVHLFRFPYGSSNSDTLRVVNELGYTVVGWTADSLGWEGTIGGQTIQSVIDHVLSELQPGEIVLMHVGANPADGTTLDADALRTIIDQIQSRGYSFVTLSDLLRS